MRILHIPLCLITIAVLADTPTDNAPIEPPSQKDNPIAREVVSAYNYLLDLHRQNRIPGDSKDMHGTIRPIELELTPPYVVKYPFFWTFYVHVNGEGSFTNCYTVGRETGASVWHLQRAWRTDSEGQTVKEWPIK
jgi:hypothetical protein